MDAHEHEFIVVGLKYWSDDTGFAIIHAENKKSAITITGKIPYPCHPGERLYCIGEDVIHPTYGKQFSCSQIRIELPNTKKGIIKFLQSSKLKGIGKGYAEKIVNKFGKDVFEILRNDPNKFLEIDGLGKKRLEQLRESWLENEAMNDITLFLQSHGLGSVRAERVYQHYGDQAASIIRKNPYQLIEDINGFGFKLADQLAQSLGLDTSSDQRIHASVKHILEHASQSGHTYLDTENLINDCAELLQINPEITRRFVSKIDETNIYKQLNDRVFLIKYWQSETFCAENLKNRTTFSLPRSEIKNRSLIVDDFIDNADGQLTAEQMESITTASQSYVSLLTGGPGVGKTTTVRAIIRCFESMNLKVRLAAPTGRAAKRLEESTARSASTIHRLLEYDPNTGSFKHNEQNYLKADFIIIDEVSMVDITLMHHLLKAISFKTGILLVGDPDQLPSVGPGAILRDCINSNLFPKIHLTQIFRQANQSLIVKNAYRVKQGEFPIKSEEHTDFLTYYHSHINDCLNQILQCLDSLLNEGYNIHNDIQILTPMHKGEIGTHNLNHLIQQKMKNNQPSVSHKNRVFYRKDKIIQLQNDYDKGVFNGDIGWIESIDDATNTLTVNMSGKPVIYLYDELDNIQLAYATSIHKSQGSEYPIVILCLSTSHFMLLSQKLVYTAITRAKKQVILVAQPKSIALTISKSKKDERQTQLGEWLCQV